MAFKWFKKKSAPTSSEDSEAASVELGVPAEEEILESAIPQPEGGDTEESESINARDDAPAAIPDDEEPVGTDTPKKKMGLFKRLKAGLSKTRDILTTDIDELFSMKKSIDDDMLEELEELLITSDIGVQTAMDIMKVINKHAAKIDGPEALKATLKQELLALLETIQSEATPRTAKPHVVMVVGVNGVGKTTTIGKLAARASNRGERVLIAAADTFRAAAIEQLTIWADRAGAEIVKHKANADPAAVAFDSMEAAMARNVDVVFVDTAGRLHTKVNLMEELKKIKRTIAKKIPDAPHEVLLVLDATTGQNALSQAKLFHEAIGVSGLALTKLDGTAKGGIVISISQSLNLPLQFIGVGEGIDDLQPFDPQQFAEALF
ncbi:MAG: signal recognition particle-docking protein FtsY [Desulfobacteraceae bacterium]